MRTLETYRRLLVYVRPYRTRLVVGIVAGFFAGGSIFGVLRSLPASLAGFEGGAPPSLGRLGQFAERFHLQLLEPGTERLTLVGMGLAVGSVLFFFVIKAIGTYINRYYMSWVGARVIRDVRNALFASLHRQSLLFFGKNDVGQLISRCTNDTAAIERAVSATIADLSRAPIELAAVIGAIFVTTAEQGTWTVLVAIFLVMPLCFLPIIFLARRIKVFFRHSLQRISELTTRMHEVFTGIRVVKAFHTEEQESERFRQINHGYFRQIMKALRAELLMTPLMEVVAVLMICVLLVYCYAQGIRLSTILPLAGAAIFAYDPAKRLAKVNVELQRSLAAAERIFELLDTDTSLPEAKAPRRVEQFHDAVVFDRASFSYEATAAPAVSEISLTIRKGQVVAFVGETGSGKTTLGGLLARFYDPTSGRVTLDGVDLRDLEVAALRRLIGVVTQEVILFNDTVAANIAYGCPQATPAAIEAAARQANAHEFIVSLPDGYQRVVGEKGFVLSGGQRQRLAIARVILRNPQILILDEATSALDPVTEQQVQDALTHLMRDRTVFAIAHRLSTVRSADCLYVLDRGRIVESGKHDDLVRAGGLYAKLCQGSLV